MNKVKTKQVITNAISQTKQSNAGVLDTPGSILDLNLEHFDRVMGVNVRGAAAFIKHAARAMVGSGTRGSIVCTTSVTAEIVNGVAPFAVATSMTSRDEETAKQVEGYCEAVGILKGVALKPNHVAKAALFLASDDSIYISGHNLVLDGGFSVVKPL
ncbi:BnaC03g72470D [Brassica napus]|uniref:BnaC03g72470D protein n=1 Tax=Brassica napus TaxID=3708 RepID=A0A078IPC1_BRANA|nr:BnaC03g72470D [Brassica napus]